MASILNFLTTKAGKRPKTQKLHRTVFLEHVQSVNTKKKESDKK